MNDEKEQTSNTSAKVKKAEAKKPVPRHPGEVDLTAHTKNILRYGLIGLILIAVLAASGIWYYQHAHQAFTVYDAQVTSTMVAARAKAPGTISEMVVTDGEHVEAGDVIAHVEVNVTDDTIAQLQQNLELAKKNLEQIKKGPQLPQSSMSVTAASAPATEPAPTASSNSAAVAAAASRMHRMQELYSMGAVSAVERDQAVADYQSAVAASAPAAAPAPAAPTPQTPSMTQPMSQKPDAELIKQAELAVKQAENALKNAQQDAQATDIIAPVAGTVYYTDVAEGTEVKAGEVIVNIGDASNVWIEARVQPQDKDKVRLGQFVKYQIEDNEYQGSVQEITDPSDEPTVQDAVPSTDSSGADDSTAPVQSTSADNKPQDNSDTPDTQTSEKMDQRLRVKISLPDNAAKDLKPGMAAIVKFMLNG